MFKNQYIHTNYFKTKNDTVIWGQFQEPVYCGGKRPMTPNSIQTMTDEKVNQKIFCLVVMNDAKRMLILFKNIC